jgi:hypothetical protein
VSGEIDHQTVVGVEPVRGDELAKRRIEFGARRTANDGRLEPLSGKSAVDRSDILEHAGELRPPGGVFADADDQGVAALVEDGVALGRRLRSLNTTARLPLTCLSSGRGHTAGKGDRQQTAVERGSKHEPVPALAC